MSIIQEILKKRESKQGNGAVSLNGQSSMPNDILKADSETSDVLSQGQKTEEVKYPGKPSVMSDANYEWLVNVGYKPETISEVFNPDYNPATDGDFMTRIAKLKPQEIDEKKIDGARTMATVGDALGTLAQMFASAGGAHVKERDAHSLAVSRFSNEEKALRDLYRQRMDKYNDRLLAASASDENRSYAQHQADIKSVRDALSKKIDYDYSSKRNEEAHALKALELAFNEHKFKETQAYNKERIRQTDERNKTYARQAASRIASASQSNGKSMIIDVNAHPDDPNAIKDKFGNKVFRYNVSKDEYDSLLAQAKSKAVSDPAWADKHPGVLIEKPEMQGFGSEAKKVGSYKFNDRALVEAYAKELYDAPFQAKPDEASFHAKSKFPPGTEGVLNNPNLPVETKIEWLRSNHKLSDTDIMTVLLSRGLLLGNVSQVSPSIVGDNEAKKEKLIVEGF
jgi:hypothetical protein